MLKRSLGSLALLAILAACGGKEPVPEVEPSAPPSSANVEMPDPVTAEQIEISWTGESLRAELRSSEIVTATASENGVLLERSALGDEISTGPTNGARIQYFLPSFGDTSGVELNVEIMARVLDAEQGALRVAYSTNFKGNSGWTTFDLTDEFVTYELVYTILPGRDPNADFLGFTLDEGSVVEISEVNIR